MPPASTILSLSSEIIYDYGMGLAVYLLIYLDIGGMYLYRGKNREMDITEDGKLMPVI
jgi:hypothetical protein